MQRELNPPAIVKADVASLASEIRTAICELEAHMRRGAEWALKLGNLCLQAKEAVGHGQWGNFVRLHLERSLSTVERWMRLAKSPQVTNLEEQWKHICGHYDGEVQVTEVQRTTSELIYCRPCRVGVPKPNCWACASLRKQRQAVQEASPEDAAVAADTNERNEEADTATPNSPKKVPSTTDYAKTWRRCRAVLGKRIRQMKVALDIPSNEIDDARNAFRTLNGFISKYHNAPPKPPSKATCKRCGQPIVWATTSLHKRAALNPPEPGVKGQVEIIANIAQVVEGWHEGLYQWHWMTCPKGKSGGAIQE
jgi:hypothetical protein